MFGPLHIWDWLRDLGRRAAALPLAVRLGGLVLLALLWAYLPTAEELLRRWGESQYSHGYLVPVFALYLLWARRALIAGGPGQPSAWGLAFLVAGLALHGFGTFIFLDWLTAAAIIPCLAGLALLTGGWRALHWTWPALCFLVFMIPLPYKLEIALAHPLQRVATLASTFVLQTLGFIAFSQGNLIRLGDVYLNIIEACSGLKMLLTFFALSTAVVLVTQRPPLEKILLFLSAVPIALIVNILRIVATAILHKTTTRELAEHVFHDVAGYLMPLVALLLLWAEVRLLDWVLVPGSKRHVEEPAAELGFNAWGLPMAPTPAAPPAAPAAPAITAPNNAASSPT